MHPKKTPFLPPPVLAAATVAVGGWFGYRRDWPSLDKAVLAGTTHFHAGADRPRRARCTPATTSTCAPKDPADAGSW